MIQGKEICKSFDGFPALDHVTFHVPKGSVYGLVGSNGAGKSTLLRHVAGVFRQDSGELVVDGEAVFENNRIKERMAFIPDDVFYFRQASILDMKKYYEGIYPKFDAGLFQIMRDCFTGLDFKQQIRRMSKGMQKQAAFLLAISMRPDLMLLDEPVDGLDPVIRRQIWSILMGEVEKGEMTVFVSSHNLRELEDVCDYVGIMHKGKVILERSLTELQGSVTKLQVAFEGEAPDMSGDLDILYDAALGRVHTMIIRGSQEEVQQKVQRYYPLLVDMIPLNLEEIFIYELGGEDYAVKDILL